MSSSSSFLVGASDPGLLQFLAGVVFFPTLFSLTHAVIGRSFPADSALHRCRTSITVRLVSSFQALVATTAALVIIGACGHDVIHATHWATRAYIFFSAPYFFYDVWAMKRAYDEVCAAESRPSSWGGFLRRDAIIVGHHVLIPLTFFPAVLAPWRRQRGDYLVACFYLVEASTPFVALRAALHQLKLSHTRLYVVNGILMLFVFAVCRILIFPYIYWSYGRQNISGVPMPVWRVPFAIPWHCNISCGALFALQLFWFHKMIKGAVKLVNKRLTTEASDNNNDGAKDDSNVGAKGVTTNVQSRSHNEAANNHRDSSENLTNLNSSDLIRNGNRNKKE